MMFRRDGRQVLSSVRCDRLKGGPTVWGRGPLPGPSNINLVMPVSL